MDSLESALRKRSLVALKLVLKDLAAVALA